MFELAKLAGWVLSPLSLVLVFWSLAWILVWRGYRRLGLGFGWFVVFVLWILATPLVATHLVHTLERRFPALLVVQVPQADAIMVLGGALSGAHPPERPHFHLSGGADRVWHAAALYKMGKAPWVLVLGGNQPSEDGIQLEAEAARSMLLTLGVPASVIRLEGASRNTVENAQASLGMIQSVGARRVLLVTSAMHMPRALKTFGAVLQGSGVTVIPVSTDVRALPDSLHPLGRWLPDAGSLGMSTVALKEYLGLAVLALRSN